MTSEQFNQFCSGLAATTHVVQWGGADVWKVAGKVFAIGGWSKGIMPAYTFKTSQQNYHFLLAKPGYRPAPYLASRGFLWIQQYHAPDDDEALQYYLNESYKLVVSGLTKKKRHALGLR